MVRSKSTSVVSGRKQRIEGIVKNLSAKVQTKEGIVTNGEEQTDSFISASLSLQERMQPQTFSATTERNDPIGSVYHLPPGLEFSGVVPSQPLVKGKQFGPFTGKIMTETEQPSIDHSIICQIPGLDGGQYNLHLHTREERSRTWLKCIQRCPAEGVCNIVAFNTPKGVVLQTVADVDLGVELCVTYDHSYDIPVIEVSLIDNEPEQIQSKDPEQIQSKDPEEIQSKDPEEIQSKDPEEIQSKDPEEIQSKDPEEIQSKDPEEIQSKDLEQIQSKDPEQIQSKDPEEIQSKDPEQIQSKDPEQIQSKDPSADKSIESYLDMGAPEEMEVVTVPDEAGPMLYNESTASEEQADGLGTDQTDVELQKDMTHTVMTAEVADDEDSTKQDDKTALRELVSGSKSSKSKLNQKDTKTDKKGKRTINFRAYRCQACKSKFASYEEKQRHLQTAHSSECPMCNKSYSRAYLKEHMMFHLESSRVTCPLCSKVFSSISNLRKHEKKHTRRGSVVVFRKREKKMQVHQCSECQKTFKTEKQLEVHRRKHVRVVPISCEVCDTIFTHKRLLRQHQALVHHGKKPYSCKHCHKTFTQSGNVARHCRQVHGDKKGVHSEEIREKYLCRRRGCDQKSFFSRDLFIKHLEQHSGSGGVFPCRDCSGVFSTAGNLSKHKKSQHRRQAKPAPVETKFSCELCKDVFPTELLYKRHVRDHKINKTENKCNLCGKLFANRSGLFKHVRIVRCSATKAPKSPKSGKTYSCPNCDKTFGRFLELRTHRRSHNLGKQFPCDVCGKTFTQLGNLGKHKRHVHDGVPRPKEKPRSKTLTCDLCEQTFSCTSSLEIHKRLHTGLKPFKCEHCERKFTQLGGLKKHLTRCKHLNTSPTMLSIPHELEPIVVPDSSEHVPIPSVSTDVIDGSWNNNYLGDGLARDADMDMEDITEPLSPVF